jgi:CDP-paratose 2-epimerase
MARASLGLKTRGGLPGLRTIAALLGRPMTIYGDGKQVRDVLHVADLARAYEIAVEKIEQVRGEVFNIGGGANFSLAVREVFPLLEKFLGQKVPYSFGDWRPGDQPVYISDIAKAKEKLGWAPTISPEDGVKTLFDWCQKNKEIFTKLGF